MLKTFHIGGIHPPECKLSAGGKPVVLPVPGQVVIPLSQHAGAPAKLLVAKGDEVRTGMLIAEASGFISARIHSSVSGVVSKIDDVADAGGYRKQAVVIDVKDDVWEDAILREGQTLPTDDLPAEEIIERIKKAGIVGLGGAMFPTHVKLTPPPGCKADVLIINGAECEPYLTADHALMLEKSEEILTGVRLLMQACQVERACIGIENNKRDAIEKLSALAPHYPGVEIVPLKVCYPQGGEKQLIDAITGRRVASGALPISEGAIVDNIGTVFAVYEAIVRNKPLIERVVSVTGKQIKNPCNLRVRIGTPVRHLIEYAGGLPEDTGKIIGGGPMMGRALINADIPVTKGTSGILLIASQEAQRQSSRNCIRCAKCVAICCMGLEPNYLMNISEFKQWELMKKNRVMDCIECGSCSYTCPAHRPILDHIRMGKNEVRKQEARNA
ncbi:MAG: electron transport complex subunit RsxC [Dysgonamonadaceae bacterium]|jgi:electron transport complex protein RnfC|nr:electron transport complex subunit RsxC [Dysgonamonadaceae bacterium]